VKKNEVVVNSNSVGSLDNFNQDIGKKINYVKQRMSFDNELKEKVSNRIVEKKVLEHYEKEFNLSQINVRKDFKDFLSYHKNNSVSTMENYKISLSKFFDYCQLNGVEPLKIKNENVLNYMNYLESVHKVSKKHDFRLVFSRTTYSKQHQS
jgi:hypothetical protein